VNRGKENRVGACSNQGAIMIGTYKLSAKPSRILHGACKGQLQSVEFTAASPVETLRWFALNCGQFERVFARLLAENASVDIVEALTRGEEIEFPGLYEKEEFARGFHCERSPSIPDGGFSWRDAGRSGSEART
jgi:hypothetical protein